MLEFHISERGKSLARTHSRVSQRTYHRNLSRQLIRRPQRRIAIIRIKLPPRSHRSASLRRCRLRDLQIPHRADESPLPILVFLAFEHGHRAWLKPAAFCARFWAFCCKVKPERLGSTGGRSCASTYSTKTYLVFGGGGWDSWRFLTRRS